VRETTCAACDRDFALEAVREAGTLYRGERLVVAVPWARPAPDTSVVDVGSVDEPDLIIARGSERIRLRGETFEWQSGLFEGGRTCRTCDVIYVVDERGTVRIVLADGDAWEVGPGLSEAMLAWMARRLRNVLRPKAASALPRRSS